MSKQFYNNIAPIQPAPVVVPLWRDTTGQAGLNYERERERERERVNEPPSFYIYKFFLKVPFLTALFCIGELPIVT